MSTAVAGFLATIITLPLVGFYLVYLVTVKITKNKKKSMKRAVDLSTVFFFTSVYYLVYEIWQQSFFLYMLMIILVVAIIFTLIHYNLSKDIHIIKLLKGIWRMNFLLFFIAYFVLVFYGLIIQVYSVTSM